MLNFIDTNVIKGYCFEANNYNDQCQILEGMTNLWFSEKVLDEWNRIERGVYEEIETKIQRHIQDIKRNFSDMVEIDHRDRLIRMADIKVRPFFQRLYFSEEVEFPAVREELCNKIENILLQMQSEKILRFNKLMSVCQIHARTKIYPSENSMLQTCHNGNGDRGIILDAYDLVLSKQNEELKFWTFDGGISGKCKDDILGKLKKIKDVVDLKYYLPTTQNP